MLVEKVSSCYFDEKTFKFSFSPWKFCSTATTTGGDVLQTEQAGWNEKRFGCWVCELSGLKRISAGTTKATQSASNSIDAWKCT